MTSHHDIPTITTEHSASPPGRFSEGMERRSPAPSTSRVGRFSDGLARSPWSTWATPLGSFADGLTHRLDARSARHVGSFSDGLARGGGDRVTVPRIDSQRSAVKQQIAA